MCKDCLGAHLIQNNIKKNIGYNVKAQHYAQFMEENISNITLLCRQLQI